MLDRPDPARIGFVTVMLLAVATLVVTTLSLDVSDARSGPRSGPPPAVADLAPVAAQLAAPTDCQDPDYSGNCASPVETDDGTDDSTSSTPSSAPNPPPASPDLDCQPGIAEVSQTVTGLAFTVSWSCPADVDGQAVVEVDVVVDGGPVVVAGRPFGSIGSFVDVIIPSAEINAACTGTELTLVLRADLLVDDVAAGTAIGLANWFCP